jgi:hypothetical protein
MTYYVEYEAIGQRGTVQTTVTNRIGPFATVTLAAEYLMRPFWKTGTWRRVVES